MTRWRIKMKDSTRKLNGGLHFQRDYISAAITSEPTSSCDDRVLLFYFQNVGGMNTTLAKYLLACSDATYDVIALVETWLSDNTLSQQIFGPTYSVFRCDRSVSNSVKLSGGGVVLAINSRYRSRIICPPTGNIVEQVWVAVTFMDWTLYICVVYFPPDRINDPVLINAHLESISWVFNEMNINDNIMVLGDFNIPTVKWKRNGSGFFHPDSCQSSISNISCELLDGYSTAGLVQINGVVNSNGRLLDLAFASKELLTIVGIAEAPAPLVKYCQHHPPLQLTIQASIRSSNDIVEDFFMTTTMQTMSV